MAIDLQKMEEILLLFRSGILEAIESGISILRAQPDSFDFDEFDFWALTDKISDNWSFPGDTKFVVQHLFTGGEIRYSRGKYPKALSFIPPLATSMVLEMDSAKEVKPSLFAFKDLKNLEFSAPLLESLPKEISEFKSLESLSLFLPSCKILPRELFDLVNLQVLKLLDISTAELPTEFETLPNLKTLSIVNCKNCKINKLIDSLLSLQNLASLRLENVGMEVIPEHFWKLDSLIELTISEPNLTEFSPPVNGLKSVRSLNIAYNPLLESLGDSIASLRSLEELHTKSKKLPESLFKKTKLKELWCLNSQLDFLPDVFSENMTLVFLNLAGSNIQDLPLSILKLRSLKSLILVQTPLSKKFKECKTNPDFLKEFVVYFLPDCHVSA